MKSTAAGPLSWEKGLSCVLAPVLSTCAENYACVLARCDAKSADMLGWRVSVSVGFWQNGFCAFLFSSRKIFLRILSPDSFLFLCGRRAQDNPPGKSSRKSFKIHTAKIPGTVLQRGWANICKRYWEGLFKRVFLRALGGGGVGGV